MRPINIDVNLFNKLLNSKTRDDIILPSGGVVLTTYGWTEETIHVYKYPSDPQEEIASFKKSELGCLIGNKFSEDIKSKDRISKTRGSIFFKFYQGKNKGDDPIKIDRMELVFTVKNNK